jgi:hypothetical protein
MLSLRLTAITSDLTLSLVPALMVCLMTATGEWQHARWVFLESRGIPRLKSGPSSFYNFG